jgi:hypothetical protein
MRRRCSCAWVRHLPRGHGGCRAVGAHRRRQVPRRRRHDGGARDRRSPDVAARSRHAGSVAADARRPGPSHSRRDDLRSAETMTGPEAPDFSASARRVGVVTPGP